MPAYRLAPMPPTAAETAAALHESLGFTEIWDRSAFAALLAMPGTAGNFAISSADASPVGQVLWRVVAGEAEILTIGVLPALRLAGIGRLLLEGALTAMRQGGAERAFLEVAATNQAANALYLSFGFERVGWRPAYYKTPSGNIDAAILEKRL